MDLYKKDCKIFKIGKLFYLYITDDLFWFRFFNGYGIHGSNIKKSIILSSERYGYKKYIRIFGWKFRILKP
jgi:lysozyme family protein